MTEPLFLAPAAPLDLHRLLAVTGATVAAGAPETLTITGLGCLDRAGPTDLAWLREDASAEDVGLTRAGACLVSRRSADALPPRTLVLVSDEPAQAFARAARALYPSLGRPEPLFGAGVAPGAVVHPDARLEPDVAVDPGAVVGPRAEIGRGAVIGANAVVGPGVRIGRGSTIGPGAVLTHALIGDRVVVGPGARLGHAAPSAAGEAGDLGRVVVQDEVVIGANVAVPRGKLHDTVIGEKSLVGDLAWLGPDSLTGRGCVIFAHGRVAEGAALPDFFVLAAEPASRPAGGAQGPT